MAAVRALSINIRLRNSKERGEREMYRIKSFYTCPKCGEPIDGTGETYYTCLFCGRKLCHEAERGMFKDRYCGGCGNEITLTHKCEKVFYRCGKCGHEVAGEKEEFITCASCGKPLYRTRMSGKPDGIACDNVYCLYCGAEISAAADEATATDNRKED
jgi:DNA-directed RNA polymerase subunit RPC12/RpoP